MKLAGSAVTPWFWVENVAGEADTDVAARLDSGRVMTTSIANVLPTRMRRIQKVTFTSQNE